MSMMQVGEVGVAVGEHLVGMLVRMRLSRRRSRWVCVLVMFVVYVPVTVRHRLVRMDVLVPLGQVQPQADPHQPGGEKEHRTRPIMPENQSPCRTHEWREGEVCSRSRRTERAHGQDIQDETHAIAEESECQRRTEPPRPWKISAK